MRNYVKKVMYITSDSSYTSGAFRSMVKLCELLRREGKYEPFVVLPRKGTGEKLLKKKNISYIVIHSFRWIEKIENRGTIKATIKKAIKLVLNIFAIIHISFLIYRNKIDIVHINTIGTYVGAIAAINNKVPFVWHIRETLGNDHNAYLIFNNSYKLINKANKIICISQYVFNNYIHELSEDKMSIIYNGVDEKDFFYDKCLEEFNSCSDFLCIGNMNSNKGQECIIRAASQLADMGYKFHITFVGEGARKSQYMQMASGLKEYISFFEPEENVQKYYQRSKAFIMASKAEAFGRTTVEALMSGCLLIGSNSGATPEIIIDGKTGYLYECDDIDGLTSIMINVIEGKNDGFAIMRNGQKSALEKFSAKNNMEKISDIYDSILNL